MSFSTKHYVIAIISIFLALGIGIFVGLNIGSDEVISEKQKNMLNSLEKDFIELSKQNKSLKSSLYQTKKQLKTTQNSIRELLPFVIKEKLKGKNIIIVDLSGNYVYPEIVDPLKISGVNLGVIALEKTSREKFEQIGMENLVSYLINGIFKDNSSLNILLEQGLIRKTGANNINPDVVLLIVDTTRYPNENFLDVIKNNLKLTKASFILVSKNKNPDNFDAEGINFIADITNPINQIRLIKAIQSMSNLKETRPEA